MADLKIDLKNIKLTKDQQQMLALGIVLVGGLVYGYWNFVLKPLNTKIVTLTEQAKVKRENIAKARRLKAQWEEYNQRMSRVQTAESYVLRRMPPAGDFTAAVSRMIKLTLEGNVQIAGYRADDKPGVGTKSEFEGFEKRIATITLVGGYHRLGQFLSRLSGEDLVFNIEDARLNKEPDVRHEAERISAQIEVKLVTYSEAQAVKK